MGRALFVLVHFQKDSGAIELELFSSATLGLDLAELSEGALELACEALAVNADLREGTSVFPEPQGHREGSFRLRMVGVDVVFHFGDTEREEVRLDCGGAAHPPRGIDERLDEMGFGGAFGLVFIEKGMG